VLVAGVDIGSRSIEVVLCDGAQVIETATAASGPAPAERARALFASTLERAGVARGDLARVVATGYGRNYFGEADAVSSEILCHARGVSYVFPEARTVIDIGGQDSKMIQLDAGGRVVNFVMNDRCAAGTGKYIEMVGLMLDVAPALMGGLTAGGEGACEISSMCAVFAESEIIGLTQGGAAVDEVLRGVFRSVARRTLAMAGRIPLAPAVVFTGGVALNAGVARALERESGVRLSVPPEPQLTGALGASLLAADRARA
jgi:predicted CoA-substrate-specific enzyme activase